MAENHNLTVVVRGGPNSGRSQLAKQLEEFLREKGYADVHLLPSDEVFEYKGDNSIRDVPILIMEAK